MLGAERSRTSIAVVLMLLAVALLASLAAGCGGGDGEAEGGQTTIAGVVASDHGAKDVAGQEEVELELDDNYFEPTVLKGSPGERLTITLANEGEAEHNFTIETEKVDIDVEPGEEKTVSVTFPKSGTIAFYCEYHKSLDMAGGLEASSSDGSDY
ncbi:MAG: cupredoxin domain-containing protein [Actinomycetota bacterium]|nr:cupredoxin domain-containing protein [Actinomycetota bacterium]